MLYDMREDYRRPERRGFFGRNATNADCAAAGILGFLLGTVLTLFFAMAVRHGLPVCPGVSL